MNRAESLLDIASAHARTALDLSLEERIEEIHLLSRNLAHRIGQADKAAARVGKLNAKGLEALFFEERRCLLRLLHRLAKIRARTPARVYAKALAVRKARGYAAGQARSLADDLLGDPGLRAAIWGDDASPIEADARRVAP